MGNVGPAQARDAAEKCSGLLLRPEKFLKSTAKLRHPGFIGRMTTTQGRPPWIPADSSLWCVWGGGCHLRSRFLLHKIHQDDEVFCCKGGRGHIR
jgi:hypothetical protein